MNRLSALSFATLLLGGATMACGEASVSTLSEQDMLSGSPLTVNNETCNTIWRDLELAREMLAATNEWRTLEKTDQYKAFGKDIKRASDAHCQPHEPHPTHVCETIGQQLRTDWKAVTQTAAYKDAEKTPLHAQVRDGYAALRKNNCWQAEGVSQL